MRLTSKPGNYPGICRRLGPDEQHSTSLTPSSPFSLHNPMIPLELHYKGFLQMLLPLGFQGWGMLCRDNTVWVWIIFFTKFHRAGDGNDESHAPPAHLVSIAFPSQTLDYMKRPTQSAETGAGGHSAAEVKCTLLLCRP